MRSVKKVKPVPTPKTEEKELPVDPSPVAVDIPAEDIETPIKNMGEVSTYKMERSLQVVQDEFNLKGKGYVMTGFNDKNSKIVLALSNRDFDIVVSIKSPEDFSL